MVLDGPFGFLVPVRSWSLLPVATALMRAGLFACADAVWSFLVAGVFAVTAIGKWLFGFGCACSLMAWVARSGTMRGQGL